MDYSESAWDTYFENLPDEEFVRSAIEAFPELFVDDIVEPPKKTRVKLPKIDFWQTTWG